MNNKRKSFLFLGLTLLILLISVGAASATDSDDMSSNSMHDSSPEKISSTNIVEIQHKEVKKEPVNKNTTQKKNNNIKTDKQPKKAVEPTTTVDNYETLKNTWNNIKTDGDNTTDYTINVKNGNYKFDEELEINSTSNINSITINGENPDKTIFDGQNTTRLFNLNTTTLKINFNNITFANGFNNRTGGAIYSKATLNINNSKFINNTVMPNNQYSSVYGGTIKLENNFTITYSLFENNTMIGRNTYGGALSTTNVVGSITNCEFINNEARYGTIYVDQSTSTNNITLERCLFNSNSSAFDYDKPHYMGYNYYNPGSYSGSKDLVIFVNNKSNFNMINQKNNNVTIQLYKYEPYYAHPFSNITLGLNKSFKISSSSDLINTTDITLSPENNYTAVIDISNLPIKHDDISLYMDNMEVAKVVYNYTNIEIKDITAKPGETIKINTKITTNNKEAVQNGKVAFKLNGCTIGHANVKVGVVSFNYKIPENYSAKDYILSVVYGSSNDFIDARMNSTLHLKKLATSTNLTTSIDGNTLKITVDPKDENGNTVKDGKICVKIEGKTLQNLKITGKTTVNFTIPKSWNNREIKVLAIYGENNNHKQSRTEIKTKLTLPTEIKEVKKDTINNYYVSANTGSDTNTGSQSSPFKTIQKAITTIQANNQTANIYLDGQFKGVGNTNLTIPGNLHINFIGVGNSSIDGEVNYTLSNTSGVWGASLEWKPYNNGRGNWAMKITQGNGLITINNITIKNCWNAGGSSISAYPTATVDNYGNLEVNNVSFIFNHGGVGASIRNNLGANLNVTNSLFEENRKSSSTGNYGAGLYNNGTATVINSTFQNNYARWGTITNDKNLTLINSTIRDNIGYNGGSTYKTGSGITINTGGTDYFNQGDIGGITTVINGCYFTNNDQLDIYVDEGEANITNCVFNRSTGIRGAVDSNKLVTNVINNTIINPQPSSIQTSLSSSDMVKYALYLSGASPYLIENNTGINLTCNAIEASNSYSSTLQNIIIRNNTFDNSIYLYRGSNNIIENNNITSKQEYAIYLGTQSNTKVTGNYLISSQFEGDGSVSYQGNNIVANNTPKMALIRLNNENFYQYFDDDGNLKSDYDYITQITLIGALNDKTMIFNQTLKIGQQNGWPRIVSNNTTIIVNNGFINVTGLRILNTNNQPVFILNTDNNIITGSNLTTNNTNTIIINNTKNNTITGNILIADLLVGDESVTTPNTNNITGNTPLYRNYMIDDTTYNTYFNSNGTINVPEDKPIRLLIGNLNNKTLILNNNKDITIMNYHEITQHKNITIKTEANTTLNITNITITNTNKKPVLEIRGIKTIIKYTNLTSNDNIILFENTKDIEIEYNNITVNTTNDVKAITMKNVENIDTFANNLTITANITPDNNTHTIIAIDGTNITKSDLYYFNITITNLNKVNDNIYAINIINPEIYDNSLINLIRDNKIKIKGFNNACAINMTNQKLSINDNIIQTSAKNTIAMNITTSSPRSNYQGMQDNTINMISQNNNTGIILNSCENVTIRETNFTNTMSENITAIQINNSTNTRLLRVVMNLNGKNITAINLNQTNKMDMTLSNITVNSKNINQAPIQLNNAEETSLTDNNIITTTEYTIKVDKNSSKSIIENNNLYALNFGDDSVLKESNNYIIITDNTPIKSYKNLLLNDYTYDAFFDENGVLKDEIPTGANITVVGNLYDRVLNITRPVNMMGDNALSFINTTIIVNAKNTNLTNIYMNGYDNTKLIINANNCNINIPTINMQNTLNENITLITLNGNNNNISITDITTKNNENNANITLLQITGKQNSITIGSMQAVNFNNSTAIKLDNADKNYINIPGRTAYTVVLSMDTDYGIILNNSNYNSITSTVISSENKVGFILSNSSNNIIYNAEIEGLKEKALLIENNSNYNKIFGFRITSSTLNVTPVSIINSSHNILKGNIISFTGDAYPVEILNGFENEIKNNALSSTNYKGDNGVYQETISDDAPQNNKISENTNTYSNLGSYIRINNELPLKIHQTITLTARPVDYTFKGGNFTFFVNGEEIGTVETQKTETASINYTITGNEGDKLIVTVVIKDSQSKIVTNSSVSQIISKLDSNILLPNIISNNGQTIITAIVLDEEGNIQTTGKVAIKLNGKTQGVVNIHNGIAQLVVDSSKLSAKNYTLTAVYSGNSMTEKTTTNATLTITKTTPKIVIQNSTLKRTNNTPITIKLVDDQNKTIYGNTNIAVKLNGVTVQKTTSQNGIITLNMDLTQYKNNKYNLTVVSGENGLYNTSRNTTEIIIE